MLTLSMNPPSAVSAADTRDTSKPPTEARIDEYHGISEAERQMMRPPEGTASRRAEASSLAYFSSHQSLRGCYFVL